MRFVKKWCISLFIISFVGGLAFSVVSPTVASAACAESSFLGFPPWHRGLLDDKCDPVDVATFGLSKFIWHLVLNVVDMGFRLVAYLALIFILYGGFMFITSNGSSEKVAKGKNMLLNAVIGLIICIASSLLVNLVLSIMK